jgi:hypothetical protein
MKILGITRITLVSLGLLSFTATAQMSPAKMYPGKKHKIVLKESAKLGDKTFAAGTYTFQHQTILGSYYVHFQKLEEYPGAHMLPKFKPMEAGVFPCKLEPAPSRFKKTTVVIEHDAQGAHITKLEIKGEGAFYVF